MVSIILADNLLAVNLPQPRVMVGTGRHQVRRIRTEGAVPDPSLMAGERCLEGERLRLAFCRRVNVNDLPDLRGVVGAACG